MSVRAAAIGAAMVLATMFAPRADAQAKRLSYVRDTAFNLMSLGIRRPSTILVRKDGYMVIVPEASYYGEAFAIDSSGKKQPWQVTFLRGPDSEIGWVIGWGWLGDSVWVVDRGFEQIALIGSDGKVAHSIGFPSWVRPLWKDRRRYPLFSRMTWYAMYSDSTLLVEPAEVRRLFDTPDYDPDQKLLVRVDRDGRILRTVASAPALDGRLLLRSGTERKSVNIPFFARTHWKTSTDGERVAVVTPITSDSGAFRVTMLTGMGDTVFSRRYVTDARRAPKAAVDSFVAGIKAFGRYTEQQMRDTIWKLVPEFASPVVNVSVGVDHSVWVSVRRPQTDIRDAEWIVIDAKGDLVGMTTMLRSFKLTAASLDRLWTIENDRVKQTSSIVRYARADAKGARPTRSASSSGSSTPARPRE